MFHPTLDWLRQVVDPAICSFSDLVIKTGATPTATHRMALDYPADHSGVASVIVKAIAPDWPGDPCGQDRELTFYAQLLPQLGLKQARLYFVGVDPETRYRLIVMEDLTGYRCPPPTHCWTPAEARCMLRTYARLHAAGCSCLPPEEQRGWMWRMHLQEKCWRAVDLLNMIDDLIGWGAWSPLPRIEEVVEATLARGDELNGRPVTLLHNDVFPPNVALPTDLDGEAILLDWEMVGWGLAELDLAFMFMQPYGSARRIDRGRALDYYWTCRRELEGTEPSVEERRELQHHADAVWALSLVPVAYRVAAHPYPAGSAPAAYWDAMFGVLHKKLNELCRGTASAVSPI